ncbi:MAG: carbohydrate binding family 9 domain-containing protein, partial [Acidobacteria bacterium]|nr:carbohydrate binding family 9 domain-containing protein [Acidobacteriota bacterium]
MKSATAVDLLLLLVIAPAGAAAQPLVVEGGAYTVHATRITTAMRIDGRLDEPVYEQVPAITDYIQQEPREGAPISERTESWVLFDDDNLYIVCRCWDTHPERIVANDMRRDSTNLRQNDNFAVMLDTFHDRRNGVLFYVTPVGGMFDGATTDERILNGDWNTVWQAKVGRFDGGWIAEMAIPFKSLRYAGGRDQVWGINLRRTIRAKNEYAYITPLKRQWGIIALFRASAAATLVDLQVPPPAKNLEIKPSAISRVTTDLLARPAIRNDFAPDAALDVKYGVTKSLTADFTYNTDFAQVEADEVQVNLTRFSLLYPEKREFFLEGQGLFTFGNVGGGTVPLPGTSPASGSTDAPTIFYSRRIGLESGVAVPMIGGGRLSGRAGKWSVGALNIASDAEDTVNAVRTDFTVLRVRRDILRRSAIGALITARSASTVAPGSNQVAGVDGNFSFFQNVYLNGYLAKSQTETRDGDDTSYRAQFNYAADRYGLQVDRLVVPANFNPEVGFVPRTSFRRSFASARFSPRPARNTTIRKYYVESSLNYTTDNNNHLESREAAAAFRVELQNSDAFHVEYFHDYEFLRRPFTLADNLRI